MLLMLSSGCAMRRCGIAIYHGEAKIYSDASIKDSFSDDRVIVVLTNTESAKLKEYTVDNFPEIQCSAVIDLYSSIKIKQNYSDMAAYNRILCLELCIPGKEKVLMAIESLEKRMDVKYVGPDYLLDACAATDVARGLGVWASEVIKLPEAQACVPNGATVRVGVIDSGIDATHPDLANKVNADLSRNFSDLSNVTQVDSTTDRYGHGTHVAGIIAARNATNGSGGVCSTVELVSLKFTNSHYDISCASAIKAIDYADEIGIPILNFSYGFSANDEALLAAIRNYDGLFVCSAGNKGLNLDSSLSNVYPAEYELDNLITVGASERYNNEEMRWVDNNGASNYGKNSVDIFAPGASILSCFPSAMCVNGSCTKALAGTHKTTGYHSMSGTSMATPFVTGVAALILSQDPDLTSAQLKNRILTCSDTVAAFSNLCVNGRRLNAYKTVHPHGFTYAPYGSGMHECTCTTCGHTTLATHVWEVVSLSMPLYRCTECGYQSSHITGLNVPEDFYEE